MQKCLSRGILYILLFCSSLRPAVTPVDQVAASGDLALLSLSASHPLQPRSNVLESIHLHSSCGSTGHILYRTYTSTTHQRRSPRFFNSSALHPPLWCTIHRTITSYISTTFSRHPFHSHLFNHSHPCLATLQRTSLASFPSLIVSNSRGAHPPLPHRGGIPPIPPSFQPNQMDSFQASSQIWRLAHRRRHAWMGGGE